MKSFFLIGFTLALIVSGKCLAASDDHAAVAPAAAPVDEWHLHDGEWLSFELKYKPLKPRGFVFPQLACAVMPGFDQWWEHQYYSAAFYTAYAGIGSFLAVDGSNHLSESDITDLSSRDDRVREAQLGSQMVGDAGFLSAYQSFRTAVRSQQPNGKFLFLKHEETLEEIYQAPIAFSEVVKTSTYVPLLIALSLGILDISDNSGPPHLNGGDAFYSGAYSYGAGTSEEAFFRGWIMPVSYHYMGNEFWSNTTTAVIFGAAHISPDNPVPWPQFALGWYLGYLTQRNEWTLKQSIFIHTWWDIITFASSYYSTSRHPNSSAAIMVPLLSATY